MITQKDIKKAYVKVLRDHCKVKKIYETAVEEGYETPSFFVQMIPLQFRKRETASIVRSQYMIETTYLETTKNESIQMQIAEAIRSGLGDFLVVGDRKIMIEYPEIQFTGQTRNIMQFVFQISFYEDIREIEKEPYMKQVNIKEELENGNAID